MGAILGLAGVGIFLLLVLVLWMTGAFQPRGTKRAGKGSAGTRPTDGRVSTLD